MNKVELKGEVVRINYENEKILKITVLVESDYPKKAYVPVTLFKGLGDGRFSDRAKDKDGNIIDVGNTVYILGSIQTGSYLDKQDKKVYTTDIVAHSTTVVS